MKELKAMTEEKRTPAIIFAPGCFDSFEGTQEELDDLVKEIKRLVETGELMEKGKSVDIDQLFDEDPELAEKLAKTFDENLDKRNLQ